MQASDFKLRDQNGNAISLDQFRDKKVVLFFYPKAETPGCTVEACGMRDNMSAFDERGVTVIGVSPDEPDELKSFDHHHDLNFTLLSDPTHEIAEKYGVWKEKSFMGRRFMGVVRTTFLIDEKGAIIKRYDNVNPVVHATEILADLGVRPVKAPVRKVKMPKQKKAAKKSVKNVTKKRAAKKTAKKSVKSAKKLTKKKTKRRR